MSMKSTFLSMAAMAMVGAQNPENLYAFGNGYPMGKPAPKELDKSQQKKCKSCANFVKQCYKGSCPWHSVVDPWQAACKEHYKKKKR